MDYLTPHLVVEVPEVLSEVEVQEVLSEVEVQEIHHSLVALFVLIVVVQLLSCSRL